MGSGASKRKSAPEPESAPEGTSSLPDSVVADKELADQQVAALRSQAEEAGIDAQTIEEACAAANAKNALSRLLDPARTADRTQSPSSTSAPDTNPEPEAEGPDPAEVAKDELAADIGVSRAHIDPLIARYDELAGEQGVLTKAVLLKAVPALQSSPFFGVVGVGEMLVSDGSDGQEAGTISKKSFLRVLSRFCAESSIDVKIRGVFDLFRRAGGQSEDYLARHDISMLVGALYSQESETMIEVMVTGLMNGIGTEKQSGERVITFENFRSCCREIEELDQLLTLTFPATATASTSRSVKSVSGSTTTPKVELPAPREAELQPETEIESQPEHSSQSGPPSDHQEQLSAAAAEPPNFDYASAITELYRKHNPDKVASVPQILEKYRGQEDVVYSMIKEKYEAS